MTGSEMNFFMIVWALGDLNLLIQSSVGLLSKANRYPSFGKDVLVRNASFCVFDVGISILCGTHRQENGAWALVSPTL